MSSLLATATAAICQALQAAPAVAPAVYRARSRAISEAVAVNVRPLGAEVQERILSGPLRWQCRIGVECYVKTTTQTAPDVAVDALLEAVYARLMDDPSLGGAVKRIEPESIAYDFEADGDQSACATLVLSVTQFSQINAL